MRHQAVVLSTQWVFSIAISRTAVAADDSAKVILSAEAFTYAQLMAQGVEPMKYPRVCFRFIASRVAESNLARQGAERREWLFPSQALQRSLAKFDTGP